LAEAKSERQESAGESRCFSADSGFVGIPAVIATYPHLRTIRLLAGVCPPFPGWLRAGRSNLPGPNFFAQNNSLTASLDNSLSSRRPPGAGS